MDTSLPHPAELTASHFGGGGLLKKKTGGDQQEEEGTHRPKSRQELIEELILKSKQEKVSQRHISLFSSHLLRKMSNNDKIIDLVFFFHTKQNVTTLSCRVYFKKNYFFFLSARATGAERGGTGINRETRSGVEEHSVSDGEEDAQSWISWQTGGEAQSRNLHENRLTKLYSTAHTFLLISFAFFAARRIWHDGQRARLWDEGSALGEDEEPRRACPRGKGEAPETGGTSSVVVASQ